MNKAVELAVNRVAELAVIMIPFCVWSTYFFEDLPTEINVEHWERLHPGQAIYYQSGIMHTLVNNVSCDVLGTDCDFVDAATLYRYCGFYKKKAAEPHS